MRGVAGDDETERMLQRWHAGDRDALVRLVERDRDWIERRLRSRRGALLRRLEETGDGMQELMLRALDYAPRFQVANRAQFRALLGRMLGNLLVDRARCLGRQPPPMTVGEESASRAHVVLTATGGIPAPVAAAAQAEELGWIRLGLEFLPQTERRLIRARSFEEQDFESAGAELGLSADAARMRFQRAMLKLAGIVQRLQRGDLEALLAEQDEAERADAGHDVEP
jgi:RNA polymerase sigma factor (sigma-70 family)